MFSREKDRRRAKLASRTREDRREGGKEGPLWKINRLKADRIGRGRGEGKLFLAADARRELKGVGGRVAHLQTPRWGAVLIALSRKKGFLHIFCNKISKTFLVSVISF